MRDWLHRFIDHPGWAMFVFWWSGPVWLSVVVEGHAPGFWIAGSWSLFGLILMAGTVPPRKENHGQGKSKTEKDTEPVDENGDSPDAGCAGMPDD